MVTLVLRRLRRSAQQQRRGSGWRGRSVRAARKTRGQHALVRVKYMSSAHPGFELHDMDRDQMAFGGMRPEVEQEIRAQEAAMAGPDIIRVPLLEFDVRTVHGQLCAFEPVPFARAAGALQRGGALVRNSFHARPDPAQRPSHRHALLLAQQRMKEAVRTFYGCTMTVMTQSMKQKRRQCCVDSRLTVPRLGW